MVNSKVAVLLILAAVLVAAVVVIAFTQYASAQANATRAYSGQVQQGAGGSYYQSPQQGYYSSGQQYGGCYGYSGMGMCGRIW